jgi:hypothetical protein
MERDCTISGVLSPYPKILTIYGTLSSRWDLNHSLQCGYGLIWRD